MRALLTYYEADSFLHRRNPALKLLSAFVVMAAAVLAFDPWTPLALLILGLAALTLAGCHSPLAQQQMQQRLSRLQTTADRLARNEQRRPEKLRADIAGLQKALQRGSENLRRNTAWMGELWQQDVTRFRARQPEYRATFLRLLRGHPERLEENAIMLFY